MNRRFPVVLVCLCAPVAWAASDAPVELSRPWLVYLVQNTHTDVGYTRPQAEMLPEHLRFIDEALDCCDLTDDYPDDAKFRWTCEVAWTVREYLHRRPASQIERLKRRVQEGRIEVTGMLGNMSEIATEASLAASLQPIREFKDAGLPVKLAMQNDVNGVAWCLVDYFQPIGVRYLTMGINKTRSLLPFDVPTAFWWESPSGSRLLAFRSDHYHRGNLLGIHRGKLEAFEADLLEYLRDLEQKQYALDRIPLQYSGYHQDNAPPAIGTCDLVKAWNATHDRPRLRLATASEFMEDVAKTAGARLPVYRQAWPDWWTDGFGSAARETAVSREVHSGLLATQGLLAMASLVYRASPGAPARAMGVQEAVTFYDEHTFGSSVSIRDPTSESTAVQWGQKGSYAWEAAKQAGMLREEAIGALQPLIPRTPEPTLVVFNTLNWARSGPATVFIDHELLGKGVQGHFIDTETQGEVPAQAVHDRPEGGYWVVWAKDVPPLGWRTYRIRKGEGPRVPASGPDPAAGAIENAWYRLRLDTGTGSVASLIDKDLGRELIDPDGPWRLGQFIYERLETEDREFRREAMRRTSVRNVSWKPGSGGPVWRSVLVQADLDGSEPGSARAEIRLYETEKRIELHFDLRKLPVREPEGLYVAFPFRWPGGRIVYEAQGGMVRPGENQIQRSASDWQTVQNFSAVRSEAGQILWGSVGTPLVQFGDLNCGKWQPAARIDKPYVFSWPMNNYWYTNFNATQAGQFTWSYYLTSTADASNTAATRFGWGSQVPLVARALPPVRGETGGGVVGRDKAVSLWQADAGNLLLVEARPAWHGQGVILHWREIEGKPASLDLMKQQSAIRLKSADEVNVLEETIRADCRTLPFGPYEVKFVRLNLD